MRTAAKKSGYYLLVQSYHQSVSEYRFYKDPITNEQGVRIWVFNNYDDAKAEQKERAYNHIMPTEKLSSNHIRCGDFDIEIISLEKFCEEKQLSLSFE